MLEQAVAKVRMMASASPVDFVSGDVHHMPFDDNSFDAVVDTFSLCVYEDPVQALKEMSRVLRPGAHRCATVDFMGLHLCVCRHACFPRCFVFVAQVCFATAPRIIVPSTELLCLNIGAARICLLMMIIATGGKLFLLEHSRSDFPPLAAYQDLTASTVANMGKGCFWNQNLPVLLKAAGLYPIYKEHHLGGTISVITAVGTTM